MIVLEEYKVKDVGKREVGIEIEMEGDNLVHEEGTIKHWKVTEDGSLRGESAEYVLRKPVFREDVKEVLQDLQENLRTYGSTLRPSDNCGIHIHINCQQMTFKQVLNYAVLYYILEDLLVKFCGETREGNLFCLRAKDAEQVLNAMYDCAMQGSFRRMQHEHFRYAAFNVTSLSKYGSVEFRAMRSVADFSIINTWVEMLLKIKDAAFSFQTAREIVETLSFNGSRNFADRILGPYAELISTDDMEGLIVDGVRRVQDIAFVDVPDKAAAPMPISLTGATIVNYTATAPNTITIHDELVQLEPAVPQDEMPRPRNRAQRRARNATVTRRETPEQVVNRRATEWHRWYTENVLAREAQIRDQQEFR